MRAYWRTVQVQCGGHGRLSLGLGKAKYRLLRSCGGRRDGVCHCCTPIGAHSDGTHVSPSSLCVERQRPNRRGASLRTAGVGGEPHVWTLRCESMDLPWWLRTTLFCTYYIHLVRRMLSMTGGVCFDAHKQQYTLRTGCASALTGMGLVDVCVHVSRGFRFRQGPELPPLSWQRSPRAVLACECRYAINFTG